MADNVKASIQEEVVSDVKVQRLAFLRDFIALNRLTMADVAGYFGVKRVESIRHAFRVDDVALAQVFSLVEGCGYDLNISFTGGNINDNVQPRDLDFKDVKKMISASGDGLKLKRLCFLQSAMAARGEDNNTLAAKLGITPAALRYYFRMNNLNISVLYKIAKVMDCSLNFEITPQASIPNDGTPRANYRIVMESSQPIESIDLNEVKTETVKKR